MAPRDDALINGALMAIGALGIADNVLVHWVLKLHRAIPGEHALTVEILLVAGGGILFVVGLARERRARRQRSALSG
jgi:uncharacterized membrane protein